MSVRRYDIEWALAPVVALYLQGKISAAAQLISPVVTFFDPMAVDEANRFVIEIPSAATMAESPGNFSGTCQCTVKSRWTQKTLAADMAAHFDRSNWMRDALMSIALVNDLNTAAGNNAGWRLDYIQPKREFSTVVAEGWAYSDVKFTFNGHFTA
jgi:hypothetical protein